MFTREHALRARLERIETDLEMILSRLRLRRNRHRNLGERHGRDDGLVRAGRRGRSRRCPDTARLSNAGQRADVYELALTPADGER